MVPPVDQAGIWCADLSTLRSLCRRDLTRAAEDVVLAFLAP